MTDFKNFLGEHKSTKDEIVTHTRIADKDLSIYGGAYNIEDDLEDFWKLYYKNVFVNKNLDYLTEKQNGNVIAIDYDFKYSYDTTTKQHTEKDIDNIVELYTETLKEFYNFEAEPFNIYVMEKPNVNRVEEKNYTKDGLHIIINLKMEHSLQVVLRNKLLKTLQFILRDLPLINDWNNIYDEGVVKGTCNWQLYGSRKPANEAYELKYAFKCQIDKCDNEFMIENVTNDIKSINNYEIVKLLSVQNTEHKQYNCKLKIENKIKTPIILNKSSNVKPSDDKETGKENDNEREYEKLEYFIDNGFNKLIKINKSHADLMTIGIALNTEFKKDGLELFLKIASNYSDDYDETYYTDKYNNNLISNKETPPKIASIYYIFKKYDNEKYKELLKLSNINYYVSESDLDDTCMLAKIITPTLQKIVKYCNEKWYMLDDKTQLWSCQKYADYYIINEIRKYIDYSNLKVVKKIKKTADELKRNELLKSSSMYLASYKKINSCSFMASLNKQLVKLLLDNKFVEKLDVLENKLAFKNGIFNLTTLKLEPIKWNDFITDTIPYDYEICNEEKKTYLKEKLKEIMNNNEVHLEYWLSIIGFCFLATPHLEKSIYCMLDGNEGNGDNGKTFYFDILTDLLPNYVYKSKGTMFEDGNTKVHKQLVKTKGKRLVWTDEFSRTKKSNAELMKEVGDGFKTENEIMHGTCENINILFKLFILTNHIMIIDPEEKAVFNRYKQLTAGSHFDRTGEREEANPEKLEFIADVNLGDKIKKQYYNEVFSLIIEYANKYIINGKLPKIPEQFITDAKKTKSTNDEFGTWFDEHLNITDNTKRVALKQLVQLSEMSEKLVKEGMARKKLKYNKDLSKLGKDGYGKTYKGGYEGVEIIPIDEEEDDKDK